MTVLLITREQKMPENEHPDAVARLEEMLSRPEEYQLGDERIKLRSAKDQLELEKYVASVKSQRSGRCGIKITRMRHGDAL